MSSTLNKVTLIGNLGKDPDIRTTQNGKEICNLTLATSESWKDKSTGERKKNTEWHRIVIFNEGLVNVVKMYVKKGSKLYIEGQLRTRKWQDKSGVDRYSTEIVLQGFACKLLMLNKAESSHSEASQEPAKPTEDFSQDLDDEIPF